MPGLLGKKIGMTSVFSAEGKNIPCTVIEVGPCVVTQIKSLEKDGYEALQLGFVDAKEKHTSKPLQGHFQKAGVAPKRHLAEFKGFDCSQYNLGDVIDVNFFEGTVFVDVVGTSKGKGFQGPIKRHGQSRGPETHGSRYHRRPGSMGACSYPGRVFKNKKLAGHMGSVKVTVQNLEVVKVDAEKNLLLIKGAIPGAKGSVVTVKSAIKGSN